MSYTLEQWEQKFLDEFPFCKARSVWTDEYILDDNGNHICFGFECGIGWYPILWDCFSKIKELLLKDPWFETLDEFRLRQVKEKYGTLRIYTGGLPASIYDDIQRVIGEAEDKSGVVCELCGSPGKLYTDGWWITRCDKCYRKS